jgi:hypothetical protein
VLGLKVTTLVWTGALKLSNRFSIFFLGKIQTIKDNLQKANETNDKVVNILRADVKFTGQHLTGLAPASSDEIGKLLALDSKTTS